jgi:hypothetical protein
MGIISMKPTGEDPFNREDRQKAMRLPSAVRAWTA